MVEEAGKSLIANGGVAGATIVLTGLLVWFLLKWFMAQVETLRAENAANRASERKENADARSEERGQFLDALTLVRGQFITELNAERTSFLATLTKDREEHREAIREAAARHEAAVERTEQRWAKANAAICLRIERVEDALSGRKGRPEGGEG